MTSLKTMAKIAGFAYLILIITGIFAEFFVRAGLTVPGDAAATAGNILGSQNLFRLGIAADVVMIICDILLALIFYLLFKTVNQGLALLAAFFRLIQAAVLAANLLNLFLVLSFLSGDGFLEVYSAGQLQSSAYLALKMHGTGYAAALVFFGFSLLILGYLILRSDLIPGIFGILLVIAAFGYLTDSFARILLSGYAAYENIFALVVFIPAFVAELAFAFWLLVKGVKTDAALT
jgi:hypothetical protein